MSRVEMIRFVEGNGAKTPPITAPVQSEAAATLVNKGGLLVVRTDLLADLADIVKQECEQRVAELIQQAGS